MARRAGGVSPLIYLHDEVVNTAALGGVAVSAVSNNTLLGVAGLWVVLYGGGLALNLNWLRKALPNSPAVLFERRDV